MSFLKNLFTSKPTKTGIVFIVEDATMYAKTLAAFVKSTFPQIKEVTIFPVGETCLTELDKNPDAVIIDYFLDSRYEDAETGLEIIKKIRATYPKLNIIVLSSQKDLSVVREAMITYHCSYVKKDEKAFDYVGELLKEIV